MKGLKMAKKPKAEKPVESQVTLKVLSDDQKLVARVAGVRNQSIKELFASEDVRDFWKHLLLEAATAIQDEMKEQKSK